MKPLDAYGSVVLEGPVYSVLRARGPLPHRQQIANQVGCAFYVEQHLNSHTNREIQHSLVILQKAPHEVAKQFAWAYMGEVEKRFGIGGARLSLDPGRGGFNIRALRMPCALLEPGYISASPQFGQRETFGEMARTGEGIDALAACIRDALRPLIPRGIIGLSVGHGWRGKRDPGAPVYQDDVMDKEFDDEDELNEKVINSAEELLLAVRPEEGEDGS